VGVQGDSRTYHHPAVIWQAEEPSAGTEPAAATAPPSVPDLTPAAENPSAADSRPVADHPVHAIDWHALQECALAIINRLDTVNRVVFSPEPLTRSLRLRPLRLTPDSVERLRTVDSRVCRKIASIDEIWQIPVVSLPLFDEDGRQAFVMRPICSRDAMTADVYHMAPELLSELIGDVRSLPWAGYLFYDITTKPPATIEWE
jgi:GMP synthase (glutamine-hydrolysing)